MMNLLYHKRKHTSTGNGYFRQDGKERSENFMTLYFTAALWYNERSKDAGMKRQPGRIMSIYDRIGGNEMAKIYVFLADGCEEIEALTPVDILRRAGEDVVTVSVTGKREVTGSHHITVQADQRIEDGAFTDADLLILPGGMPGTLNLGKNEKLKDILLSCYRNGGRLAAICAAPSVLGALGILDGRKAVCFPGFEEQLKGAEILSVPAVTDGSVTTGRGMGAAVDFALELLSQLQGKEAADRMAQTIIYRQ